MRCDVLIVGAGPTGLVLALWLTKLGIRVHIVDRTSAPGTTSRALAVQARTLELYRQLDLADAVVAGGHQVPAINLWVKGAKKAQVKFTTLGSDLTPFPFLHIFAQDQHERLLIERLEQLGVAVQRQTELVRFSDEGHRVVAYLRGPDGSEQVWETQYLAGCDGARSRVRESLGLGFPGGTYKQVFYVADVDASGPALDGQLHVDLDEADFLAVFPLGSTGRARLIGTVRDERAEHAEMLRFEDVSDRAITHLQVSVQQVHWFSTYRVHHRVAGQFRHGRAFVLGDAAHIHSPAGGQGMNTGIGDAVNLAWKLAAVLAGQAPDDLLDSYEAERIGFARRLVATTDRIFSFVSAEGRMADIVRTRLAPAVIPAVLHFEGLRGFLFRTVSQITLNYRGCPLSTGSAGDVHGGDRLPWVAVGGNDNFASLTSMLWQVHVYGRASPALCEWCADRNLSLHVFEWLPQHQVAGLARDALYLIRPDTYVALADPAGRPQSLDIYFTRHGIKLRTKRAIPAAQSDRAAQSGDFHES
ncbi:FAD-dependent oxidoreductase [Dyella choica]|uniref:FAD-dependent oxidoreductase n=1 Tax=Dyella choica TaxID=1927959 RepID=A0A3S0R3S1_9GAMM|nr:FAD-dependent oxidoreductase [Dyella choica]RUL75403.1 FAD-dependent oxidoreductase [Dyella choica]